LEKKRQGEKWSAFDGYTYSKAGNKAERSVKKSYFPSKALPAERKLRGCQKETATRGGFWMEAFSL